MKLSKDFSQFETRNYEQAQRYCVPDVNLEYFSAAVPMTVQLAFFSAGTDTCTVRRLKVQLGLQVQAPCKQKGQFTLQKKGRCVVFILKLPANVIKEGYRYEERWHRCCNSHSCAHLCHAAHSIKINIRLKFSAIVSFI